MSRSGEQDLSEVVRHRRVAPGWFVLELRNAAIARKAAPGSFVQVLCRSEENWDPLLRRPFSVYDADPGAGTYAILYTVVGRGTRWLAALPDPASDGECPPPRLDVIGPFGNRFTLPARNERAYLVGGGVGIAPLYFLAREILATAPCAGLRFLMGARTSEGLRAARDFKKLPIEIHYSTDDGSAGFRGRVTELLETLLADETEPEAVRIYGCGPQGMNESLRALAVERGLKCEIALESLMACGFGICFGCVLPIRSSPDAPFANRRICIEGPVFDARLLHPGIEGRL